MDEPLDHYVRRQIKETSHSGLVRSLGKRVGCQSPRRFKSSRLRRSLKRSFKGGFEDPEYIARSVSEYDMKGVPNL